MEVVKHLSFEDVSLNLPEAMRLQAMQPDEQLTASDLKRLADELAERSESFKRLQRDAVEKAVIVGPSKLVQIKQDLDRIEQVAAEMGTEAAHIKAIKENRPLPTSNYVEEKNGDAKRLREETDAYKKGLEQTAEDVVRVLAEFEAGVSQTQEQLLQVEEASAFLADQSSVSAREALRQELAAERRALEADEAADCEAAAAVAAKLREQGGLDHDLAPAEAHISELLEGSRALEAKQAGDRKAQDTEKHVECVRQFNSDFCALIGNTSGMELIRVDPGCIVLRLSAAGLEVELELTLDQGNIVQAVDFRTADGRLALDLSGLAGMQASVAVNEARRAAMPLVLHVLNIYDVRAQIADAVASWLN